MSRKSYCCPMHCLRKPVAQIRQRAPRLSTISRRAAMLTPTGLSDVPKVLVVEDEMVLRMRAADIVEDAGFSAVEAVNADEALAVLESRSDIALLFTDIQMPGS